LSEAELAREFPLTKKNHLDVDISRAIWFCGMSKERQDRTDTLAMAERYLDHAEKLLGREIAPLRLLVALTHQDQSKVLYWIKRTDALSKDETYLQAIGHNPDYVLGLLHEFHLPEDQEKAGEKILARAGFLASRQGAAPAVRQSRSKEYLDSKPFVDEGVALALAGNWPGAYRKLARGAAIDPDNAEAHLSLCSWHLHQGRLADAQRSCDRAVAAAAKFPMRYAPNFEKSCRNSAAEVGGRMRRSSNSRAAKAR
jgi:hypothetical protein